MKREHYKFAILLMIWGILVLHIYGAISWLYEVKFEKFRWPFNKDIAASLYQLRIGMQPDVEPLYRTSFSFIHNSSDMCKSHDQEIRIVLIVKSDPEHFIRRSVIRSTWGLSDAEIRTVFLLGLRKDDNELQKYIDEEYKKHLDIVQANFTDTYYNITKKTLSGFEWATKYCSNANFFMFVDDDYYVSTKNVLRFLRNPTKYPNYFTDGLFPLPTTDIKLQQDLKLFAGYVFSKSKPKRSLLDKWRISLKEYPFDTYPDYVTGGAYILSKEALVDIYYTSFYVEKFKLDDIYLGMLALRASIKVFHSNQFYFSKKDYDKESYRYTIASHGYSDHDELLRNWKEQQSLGNA